MCFEIWHNNKTSVLYLKLCLMEQLVLVSNKLVLLSKIHGQCTCIYLLVSNSIIKNIKAMAM